MQVRVFMERDDNSTSLPGKKDSRKVGKERFQKRVLNDYLYNLHLKFRVENSSSNISLSVFSRLRPKHIQLVQFRGRNTCLCQKHQNMVLKCKSLRENKVLSLENPDSVINNMSDSEILGKVDNIAEERIKYSEWRRVTVEKKGRSFKRMQIVSVEETKEQLKKKKNQKRLGRIFGKYQKSQGTV